MNDIEKLSPDMKKAMALTAKQESARNARKIVNEQRARKQGISVSQLRQLPALVPVNTLANNGDGQDNLLPRSQLSVGLTVTVSPWTDMDEEPGGYTLYFGIDGDEVIGAGVPVEADFAPFNHIIDVSGFALEHGAHQVIWWSEGNFSGNTQEGPELDFFIDIYHPNGLQEPDAVLLPADLPDNDITQEYLEQHGGVTFILPPFADPRNGDKFTFLINDQPVLVDQDATAPYSFLVPDTVFEPLAEGMISLTYTIVDRAGNRTDASAPQTVRLVKTPAPTMIRAPSIPEGVEISLADARDGVTVLHDYDTPMDGDFISVYWQDIPQDSYFIPGSSVDVPFEDIEAPGEAYQATVYYVINRGGKNYPSPAAQVNVDLTYIGPENPEEPEIINPNLKPLALVSSTNLDNAIAPADKGQPATITVPLYTPIVVGEIVEVFYAHALQSVGAVPVTQAHIDADEITVTLTWAMIDGEGNGTIDAFYRIYAAGKPENAQQSPITPILVTVNNLQDLPISEFPVRDEVRNIINCEIKPWLNGVDVKMEYPFEADDEITVNWVLDTTIVPPTHTTVPTNPVETSRRDFPHRVTAAEAGIGVVTYNVVWGEHMRELTEGCIVVGWHLKRGEVSGTSPLQFVRYSRHRPSSGRPVCPDEDEPEV